MTRDGIPRVVHAQLAEGIAGGDADGEALEVAAVKAVAGDKTGGLAAHLPRGAFLVLEKLRRDERGLVGVEALLLRGSTGETESVAGQGEEARENDLTHRVGDACGPLAGEVELDLGFVTGGRLIAVITGANELLGGGQDGVQLQLGGGAEADRIVLGHGFESGEGRVDPFIEEVEAQAVIDALTGAGLAGATFEVGAGTVGEERRLEVAGTETQPRQHAKHAAIGLAGGVVAPKALRGDIVVAGIGDDVAGEIDHLHLARGGIGDVVAMTVLAEVVAAHSGGGVKTSFEEGIQGRERAGTKALVEAAIVAARAVPGRLTGRDPQAECLVTITIGEIVDGSNKVVGERGRGAGQPAANDLLTGEREVESVEVNLFAPVARARDEAERGIEEGQLAIVDPGAAPAVDVVAVGGEGGRVSDKKFLEARIGNGGARNGRMRQDAIDVDKHPARVHAESAGGRVGLRAQRVVDLAVE